MQIFSWDFGKLAILVDTLKENNLTIPFFYGITDRLNFPSLSAFEYLYYTFRTRASIIQLREKDLPKNDLLSLVRKGVSEARKTRKLFFINSEINLALENDADGVHLNSNQIVEEALEIRQKNRREDFFIGKSVHSLSEALLAESQGVDYVLLSPIFQPISKPSQFSELGVFGLRRAIKMLNIPIIALGGFDDSIASEVFATGVLAVAGISWLRREVEQQQAEE